MKPEHFILLNTDNEKVFQPGIHVPFLSYRKHRGRQAHRIILRIKAENLYPSNTHFPLICWTSDWDWERNHILLCAVKETQTSVLTHSSLAALKWATPQRRGTAGEEGPPSAVLPLTFLSENPGAAADLSKHWWDTLSFTGFERVNGRGWLGYSWMMACLLSRL